MIESQAFKDLIDLLKKGGHIKSQRDLAEKIGVHEQIITDAKASPRPIKLELLLAIQDAFPSFDLKSYIGKKASKSLETLQGIKKNSSELLGALDSKAGIPYYDIDVSAGPMEMFSDQPEAANSRIIVPGLQDCDFSINVWGDSMYPEYKNGDIILCKEIRDKSIIAYGEAYLIVTKELRTVKFLQKGSTPATVVLRSENEKFDPFEVPKDAILKLYLVMAKIRRNSI